MAIYNEILVGRYARALQKIFGIKGSVPTKQLSGEIMPVQPFFSGSENRFVEGWDLFSIAAGIAGVAGNQAAIQLRNPASSGVIAVVNKLTASAGTSDTVVLTESPTQATDLATIATVLCQDRRQKRASGCVFSSGTLAAAPFTNFFLIIVGPANYTVEAFPDTAPEFVLAPGDTIRWSTQTVANGGNFSIWWRERALEESEKSTSAG